MPSGKEVPALPRPARDPLFWAGAPAVLCGVHCILAPLLVVIVPGFAGGGGFEQLLMAASAVVAVGFVAYGIRAHGHRQVWLPVVAGIGLWGLALTELLPEAAATVVGSGLLAWGLVRNAQLRHQVLCRRCGSHSPHPAGEDDSSRS